MFYWIPQGVKGNTCLSETSETGVVAQDGLRDNITLTNLWPVVVPTWIKWIKQIKKAHHDIISGKFLIFNCLWETGHGGSQYVPPMLICCGIFRSVNTSPTYFKKNDPERSVKYYVYLWKTMFFSVKWAWTFVPKFGTVSTLKNEISTLLDDTPLQNSANKRSALSPAYSMWVLYPWTYLDHVTRLKSLDIWVSDSNLLWGFRNSCLIWRDGHEDHIWAMSMAKW